MRTVYLAMKTCFSVVRKMAPDKRCRQLIPLFVLLAVLIGVALLASSSFKLMEIIQGPSFATSHILLQASNATANPVWKQQPKSPLPQLQIASKGENIKVSDNTEVHVMSAVQREDYPVPGTINVVLTAWVHGKGNTFVCCFTNSTTTTTSVQQFTQVTAVEVYFGGYLSVSMRHAMFNCPLSGLSTTKLKTTFQFVAFSANSCQRNVTRAVHEIVKPKEVKVESGLNSNKHDSHFAVCLKVAYGDLSPRSLVEWFELAKIVGVSVVYVYHHNISERNMAVFKYYQGTGFALLIPVTPAAKKGQPPRGFTHPRWEEQAWIDGHVACNDCLQRLHRYPFVAVMDLDELLVPMPPFDTMGQVMQAVMRSHPKAGGFFVESFIVLLDWPATDNDTSVTFLRHLARTKSNTLDSQGRGKSSPKMIVLPQRVKVVATHNFVANGNFLGYQMPTANLTFLHYRSCKEKLNGCLFERTRDRSLLRFKPQWLQAISSLPLASLGCGRDYAQSLKAEAAKRS